MNLRNSGAANTFISATYWHWWHRAGRDPFSMGSLLIQSGYRHPSSYWFILTGYSYRICCLRVLPACAPFLANENQAWAFEYVCVWESRQDGNVNSNVNVNTAGYSKTCSSLLITQSIPIQLLWSLCRVVWSRSSVDDLENYDCSFTVINFHQWLLFKDVKGEDVVKLTLALKIARQDLTKTQVKLNAMIADYGDVVPRREFESLEKKYSDLQQEVSISS